MISNNIAAITAFCENKQILTIESCKYFGKTDSDSVEKSSSIDEEIEFCNTSILEAQKRIEAKLLIVVFETGYINHCPEMQGEYSNPYHIKSKVSYGGGWYISTYLNLSGRGIKLSGDGTGNKKGLRTYHVTKTAFKKLEKKYLIVNIELLD